MIELKSGHERNRKSGEREARKEAGKQGMRENHLGLGTKYVARCFTNG